MNPRDGVKILWTAGLFAAATQLWLRLQWIDLFWTLCPRRAHRWSVHRIEKLLDYEKQHG